MEILRVLRVLRRRRVPLALGLLATAALAVFAGRPAPTSGGVAYTRVALDTPSSQLVESAPSGATSLGWRASLLSHLLATDDNRRQIAARLHLPFDQLAVVDPPLAVPGVPSSLPKNVSDSTVTRAPYVLSAYLPNGALPIISIEAYGPDRRDAGRLAAAAAAFLEAQGSPAGRPGTQPFVIESAAPIYAKTMVSNSGPVRTIGLFVILFGLWTAAVVILPTAVRRIALPRLRAPAA